VSQKTGRFFISA